LVFAVQPLLGKLLLPWFGGSATVWTTCLMFFQIGLLAGYAYAHGVSRWLSPRGQAGLHIALLAVSLAFLPIAPSAEVWKPSPTVWPTGWILLLLAVNLGLPFALLSATTPLATGWFNVARPAASPYRLYALSNAGSLLALVAYPFLIEPLWSVRAQSATWSWGYVVFVAFASWCALSRCRGPSGTGVANRASEAMAPTEEREERHEASPIPPGRQDLPGRNILFWVSLAACGSVMLVATTNQLCQEVAAVPFLWVLPLVVYLATFIVTFSGPRGYPRKAWVIILAILMLPTCALLYAGPHTPFWLQIVGYSATLLAIGMTCHGELARAQPPARNLTLYYLCIAAGGAIGGAFVALVAPLIFRGYWEYHLGLLSACVLTAVAAQHNGGWDFRRQAAIRRALGVGLVALVVVLVGEMYYGQLNARESARNFYGVLRIVEGQDDVGPYRRLVHGRIDHGRQYLDDDQRHWPTLYFGPGSGIDLAMRLHPRRNDPDMANHGLRVGVIGLGTGTIAAHAQRGDVLRYYEINPAVIDLCRRYFTFVNDSPATVEVSLGDARLSLERELAEAALADASTPQFDVLAVDAFRNDAIPMHLLTEECADLYFRHLKPDGLLALHVSNNFLDLTPVARAIAQRFDRTAIRIPGQNDRARGAKAGVWVIVTSNQAFLSAVADHVSPWTAGDPAPLRWTDDFAALLQVLK
jgi:SAM-dependent methyltransferase